MELSHIYNQTNQPQVGGPSPMDIQVTQENGDFSLKMSSQEWQDFSKISDFAMELLRHDAKANDYNQIMDYPMSFPEHILVDVNLENGMRKIAALREQADGQDQADLVLEEAEMRSVLSLVFMATEDEAIEKAYIADAYIEVPEISAPFQDFNKVIFALSETLDDKQPRSQTLPPPGNGLTNG